jgi:hypothetical protein
MKLLSKLVALAVFTAPSFLAAGHHSDSCSSSSSSSSDHCIDLHVSDFEGCYIAYSVSAGGIAGAYAPDNSVSTTTIAQSHIDKHGRGKLNFLSNTVWSAGGAISFSNSLQPNGTTSFPVPNNVSFVVRVLDAKAGAGVVELVNFPSTGSQLALDYVASKSNGKVVKYWENSINGTLTNGYTTNVPATGASLTINERQ